MQTNKTIEILGHASDESITEKLDAAIFRSVSHTEIVSVYVEAGAAEATKVTLVGMADDSTVTADGEGRTLVDAWGTDDDGEEWRIHLHVRGDAETAERRSDRSTV